MKNIYKQFSSEERDKIAVLHAQGVSFKIIAETIGRDKSTIYRELQRNRMPSPQTHGFTQPIILR